MTMEILVNDGRDCNGLCNIMPELGYVNEVSL